MNTPNTQVVLSGMLNTDFFKALADGSRLKLLLSLASCSREQTVSQIAECCPLSLSVVSRHLKMLKDGGILAAEKRGKEVVYWLRAKEVASQLRALADALENCCPDPCKMD
ncbi:MAG: metalloregulator ArsR/SmtB family transcription factor [Gammaproteobacteria bacterium]|nr:metalloregulator ArsR/SmtB family transcription factor [Gammaproteobacteria bacterium]